MLLGDVYVCPSVAVRQATEHSIEIGAELALLVVHGVLHLLDYDHSEPDETEAMQARGTRDPRELRRARVRRIVEAQ